MGLPILARGNSLNGFKLAHEAGHIDIAGRVDDILNLVVGVGQLILDGIHAKLRDVLNEGAARNLLKQSA